MGRCPDYLSLRWANHWILGSSLLISLSFAIRNEPRCEKIGLRGFRPGPTQTGLYSYRRWLEGSNFVYRKQRDCTICVAKTKALISFAATAKLICVFVFAYAKSRFSHNEAQILTPFFNFTLFCLLLLRARRFNRQKMQKTRKLSPTSGT